MGCSFLGNACRSAGMSLLPLFILSFIFKTFYPRTHNRLASHSTHAPLPVRSVGIPQSVTSCACPSLSPCDPLIDAKTFICPPSPHIQSPSQPRWRMVGNDRRSQRSSLLLSYQDSRDRMGASTGVCHSPQDPTGVFYPLIFQHPACGVLSEISKSFFGDSDFSGVQDALEILQATARLYL